MGRASGTLALLQAAFINCRDLTVAGTVHGTGTSGMVPPGSLGLHSAVVLFALAGIIGKALVLAPVILVAGRSAFAALTLLAVIALQRQLHRLPYSRVIALSGIVLAVHWVTFFQAIDSCSVRFPLCAPCWAASSF